MAILHNADNAEKVLPLFFSGDKMNINFDAVYYEPASLDYELGKMLKEKYSNLEWHQIDSHNKIPEMMQKSNSEFPRMKRNLIIGIRKTHKYTENHKISDYLVPYTSSGCSAMCLYCYLVCNYNKCAYLRLFVNREQMFSRLVKNAQNSDVPQTFEIGANSDLVLENVITGNLVWTIERFAKTSQGKITFPTKFDMVDPLLPLNHQGKAIFRMSVNPAEIVRKIEIGTSPLDKRIVAINKMCEAGYPTGILIAPVILLDNWKMLYSELITQLAEQLSEKTKKQLFIEIILMTYSHIHRFINNEAFPTAVELYDKETMTGRGMGKYCYKNDSRAEAELFLQEELKHKLPQARLVYIS